EHSAILNCVMTGELVVRYGRWWPGLQRRTVRCRVAGDEPRTMRCEALNLALRVAQCRRENLISTPAAFAASARRDAEPTSRDIGFQNAAPITARMSVVIALCEGGEHRSQRHRHVYSHRHASRGERPHFSRPGPHRDGCTGVVHTTACFHLRRR